MIFLGWDRPILHSATDWLLDRANVEDAPDLSGLVIVVRGRRASRRLLELLALKCSAQRTMLIPPEILTPAKLVLRLTRGLPAEAAAASPLASALAWAQAVQLASAADRDTLFRRPDGSGDTPGLRTLLGLGRHLAQIRAELGGADIPVREVVRILGEHFPNIADFEVPRWEIIAALHERMGRILQDHGVIDETDLLIQRARRGEIASGRRVIFLGVAEMPRIVQAFAARLPASTTTLVFAPQSEDAGFEPTGVIRHAHWENRTAQLRDGTVHLVERDRDQAERAAHIVESWREQGVPPTQVTIALPDAQALPRLRESLGSRGIKSRAAQGRPVAESPAFQLLRLVADYLDHALDEPPRFTAVAALARHPDVARIGPDDWTALDGFATRHFPARFDPTSVEGVSERVLNIEHVLRELIDIDVGEMMPREAARWTLDFLVRIYGEREENALSPLGRIAVHGLALLRDVLRDDLPWPARVRISDFIHVLLAFLGEEPVPEPPIPNAAEIVGWLELLEDDSPATIVTSFYEGAVPESISADPFLPGSLRSALGLGDNAMRMARDAYALTAIMASRQRVLLIAPRFNAGGDPARPSRLLLNGLEGGELARRVWHLAHRRDSEPAPRLHNGPGFTEVALHPRPPLPSIRVTAFRDYIESPRKFYFLHVLGLNACGDEAKELAPNDVGTLIHRVLADFGADPRVRDSASERDIAGDMRARFDALVREQFGRWVEPAVEIQVEEVRRRLSGFAKPQAQFRQEGWSIRYVESAARLQGELVTGDGAGTLTLTGKIDRIDGDASGQRWRIIDYKTTAKSKDPLAAHFARGRQKWIDLQLPLYLKLAAPYARAQWNVELTPENCELVYFQLPENEAAAGLSEPFPASQIRAAWQEAESLAARIRRGEFTDNPPLRPDPSYNDPALLALCGQVGIQSGEADADAEMALETED